MSIKGLIGEVHRRSLWQVLGIYVLAGWVALQVVETLTSSLGLPDWFPAFAVVLLIIGFPIVIATAFIQRGTGGSAQRPAISAAGGSRETSVAEIVPAEARLSLESKRARSTAHRLFTWRNALVGGVAAFAVWGAVAAAWLLFGGARSSSGAVMASIAVLPFSNMGGEESAYFADGIHEDILTQLAKIASLRVISRTSVLPYRDAQQNVREIARELGVDHVLEGSVRHDAAGNRVRVAAQLIDARSDEHVWAEQYDRELTDVFAIQSDLALSIVRALRAAVTPEEERRIEKRSALSAAAYDLILRGRESYGRSAEQNRVAIEFFRQAIRLDPASAEGYAELANAFGQHAQLGAGKVWADSARVTGEHAIELDPELPLAHKALGLAYDQLGQLARGVAAYRRAIELNPNYESPMINLAVSAEWSGRYDEAMPWLVRAQAIAPGHRFVNIHLAIVNAALGRFEEAGRWLELTRATEPNFIWLPFGYYVVSVGASGLAAAGDSVIATALTRSPAEPAALLVAAETALLRGDRRAARERYERMLAVAPDWMFRAWGTVSRASLAFLLRQAGDQDGSAALMREAMAMEEAALALHDEDVHHLQAMMMVHAVAGDREQALDWLDRAAGTLAQYEIEIIRRDPRLESLRADARFRTALERARANVARMRATAEAQETAERAGSVAR